MKKFLFVLSTIAVLSGVCSFGCSSKKSSTNGNELIINAFNSYEEAQRVHYRSIIGDVNLLGEGEDKKVQLNVVRTSPVLYEPTTSIEYTPRIIFQSVDEKQGYDLEDVTGVEAFRVDATNENDYDAILTFWVEGDAGILYSSYAELPAGESIHAEFPLNPLELKESGLKCKKFVLGIIDGHANDATVKTVYSFDNFRAVMRSGKGDTTLDKKSNGKEILSFASEKDLKYVTNSNIASLRTMGVPSGGIHYVSESPIGGALKLTYFGKQMYEGTDLSYYGEKSLYEQMCGVRLNEEYFKTLDFSALSKGKTLTAEAFNADPSQTRTVYLVLEDSGGGFAHGAVTLAPLSKGKIVLSDVSKVNMSKLTNMYITYDSYDLFHKSVVYVNNVRFEEAQA